MSPRSYLLEISALCKRRSPTSVHGFALKLIDHKAHVRRQSFKVWRLVDVLPLEKILSAFAGQALPVFGCLRQRPYDAPVRKADRWALIGRLNRGYHVTSADDFLKQRCINSGGHALPGRKDEEREPLPSRRDGSLLMGVCQNLIREDLAP